MDGQGYVYVCGRGGMGFPVTSGTFQAAFMGYNGGGYGGWQNCFVAKIKPDGSGLVWASYAGVGPLGRDLAIDANGDIFLNAPHPDRGVDPPAQWYASAFQKTHRGEDGGVMKIKTDGSEVIWATYIGGSGRESQAASVRVDASGYVYVRGNTWSTDFPTTPGVHDRTLNGVADDFLVKLSPDGSRLIYGTYIGGSGGEAVSTHNLAVDDQGNAYVSTWTNSPNFPTTPGALQRTFGAGGSDMAIVKFSPTGALLAGTYLGGSGEDNPDGIYVDSSGDVFMAGCTNSSNFPVTATAYQPRIGGSFDAVLLRLSGDFSELLYSTFVGGAAYDNGRSGFRGSDGCLYVIGSSDGPGWPTRNAFQATFAGGTGGYGAGDCTLAKFSPPSGARLWESRTGHGFPRSRSPNPAPEFPAAASKDGEPFRR